jgi:hypothetical protein
MPALSLLTDRLADRANPLLVRHVRQQLRSRAFVAVYGLILLVGVIATVAIAAIMAGSERVNGESLFAVVGVVYAFVLWFVQPAVAFRTVSRERDDDTWDLIELTGMTPWRMLRGMLAAGLVQGVLFTAALAPFLVMAYLLRGIDLFTVLLVLLGTAAIGQGLTAVAVWWACLGTNKASRAALSAVLLLALLGGWCVSFPIAGSLRYWSNDVVREFSQYPLAAWSVLLLCLNGIAALSVFVLALAAALLTHRAGDRSRGPRLAVLLLPINAYLWVALAPLLFDCRATDAAMLLLVVGVVHAAWAIITGIFAVTEDDALSPRQLRAIHAGGRWWRCHLPWLLGPGSSRGRVFVVVNALLAWLAIGFACVLAQVVSVPERIADGMARGVSGALAITAYGLIFLVLGDWLARRPLGRWVDTANGRRVAVVIALAVAGLLPSILAVTLPEHFGWAQIVNPFWGVMSSLNDGHEVPRLLGVYALAVVALGHLVVRTAAYWRPSAVRVTASDRDRNPRAG